jgi:hypothetical protein
LALYECLSARKSQRLRRQILVRAGERQKANRNSKKAWFLEFLSTLNRQEEPVTAQTTPSLGATHNNSLGQLWQCDFFLYKLCEETYIPAYGRYHPDENKGSNSTMYKYRSSRIIVW